ncbi:NACHT domain-containing protein [Synechocystis salina]|uniref:NACHT domain-containing NTPase n=1 Tax=Synechocystis salina LEGE 00031 TaxID=1828736 RepID=A0ABR9VSM3_9SYNC|nr:NACHT domain-containing protein [Synechocystis salina]MBE9240746.1 NACHT domain-containing NTPase [Synechocystis salina LEGE 00041]MBE9254334.1 NACHT domain-containing NTPase [Synechocystis salina LEGE 00031]
MSKRSLKSSSSGQARAKQAMTRRGWTQAYLATEAGLSTRNSVWKFLSGRPVERYIFMELCFQLGLDWEEIADLPQGDDDPDIGNDGVVTEEGDRPVMEATESQPPPSLEETYLAVKAKLRHQFCKQYSRVQSSFNLTQQFALDDIYTDLSLLPHLSHQQWLEVDDLQGSLLQGVTQPQPIGLSIQEAIDHHGHLVILGRPGSGKTTLLKYLALQCYNSQIQPDHIPVFIPLRDIERYQQHEPDWSVADYLQTLLAIEEITPELQTELLQQGKFWLLLDALDEIPRKTSEKFLQKIQEFVQSFPNNNILITSRIAAQNYFFTGFTYLEVANANEQQIRSYIDNWFNQSGVPEDNGKISKSDQLLAHLRRPENRFVLELAKTPLLLELICCAFQERTQLPSKPAKLYKEGLNVLLNRGSRSQAFQTDYGYNELTLLQKLKLLSEIAARMFAQGYFYFEKDQVLLIIQQYLASIASAPISGDLLWLKSENVLRAIQVQHGLLVEQAKAVYCFSHVIFQEYLTAQQWVFRKKLAIADSVVNDPEIIAQRLTDPHWQEVIALAISLVPLADDFLLQLKFEIDRLVASDDGLIAVIKYLDTKSKLLQTNHKPVAIRAFYLGILYDFGLNLATRLDRSLSENPHEEISLDLQLIRILSLAQSLAQNPTFEQYLNLGFALDIERKFSLTPALTKALQICKEQLPSPMEEKSSLLQWWRMQGPDWYRGMKTIVCQHHQLGCVAELSPSQSNLLRQYYHGLVFFHKCLHSGCYVSPTVQAELENNLLTYAPSISGNLP